MKTRGKIIQAFILSWVFIFSLAFATAAVAETDISNKIQIEKSRLRFDRRTSTNYCDVAVKNISEDIILTPIKVIIDSITDLTVTVANADGVTGEGKPYFEYTTSIGGLQAGEVSEAKRWEFANPNRKRFSYTHRVLGVVPDAEAVIGPEGGEVVVSNPENPIFGSKVEISAGALAEPITITISDSDLPLVLPGEYYTAGKNINFGPDGAVFAIPVDLFLPYDDGDNDGVIDGTAISELRVGIKYFNESTGQWEEVEVFDRHPELNLVQVRTTHFSTYIPYVSSQNPSYDSTQRVPEGLIITIDGSPGDWLNLQPEPIDPEGDISCGGSISDIKHVYTAIDDNFAYLMVETYGSSIPNDATLELYINFKSGDRMWTAYADMGMNLHGAPDGYLNSFWNEITSLGLSGHEVARDEVLEFKIPLTEIENASYFNVTYGKIWFDHWSNPCDEITIGARIDFNIHHRTNEDGSSLNRMHMYLQDELGNYVLQDIIASVTLYDPSGNEVQLSEPIFVPYSAINGRYQENNYQWSYDNEFIDESYYYAIIQDQLIPGEYNLVVTDNVGNTYERTYTFNAAIDLPIIPINSVEKTFDQNGNFICFWNAPDLQLDSSTRVAITAYNGQDYAGEIYVRIPTYLGTLFVESNAIHLLKAAGDRFEINIQLRSEDGNNRSYSYNEALDLDQTPSPPISEDWAHNGVDQNKWYPYYYGEGATVSIGGSDVTLETSEGLGGQATYISKYNLEGNFDIQVDFKIEDLPAQAERHHLQFDFQIGYGGDSDRALVGLKTDLGSPYYYYFTCLQKDQNWYCGDKIVTDDFEGKFKIVRQENLIKTFFSNGSNWVEVGAFNHDIGAQPIQMILYNDRGGEFAGAKAKFSNFINEIDSDGDGVPISLDNCLGTFNPDQSDMDDDKYGISCDCDDNDDSIHPGSTELLDGIDNNCDGNIDEIIRTEIFPFTIINSEGNLRYQKVLGAFPGGSFDIENAAVTLPDNVTKELNYYDSQTGGYWFVEEGLPDAGDYGFNVRVDGLDYFVTDSEYTGQILPPFSGVTISEEKEKIELGWNAIPEVVYSGGYKVELYDVSTGDRLYRQHLDYQTSWVIEEPPLENGQSYMVKLRAYKDLKGHYWGKTVAGTIYEGPEKIWNGDRINNADIISTLGDWDCFGLGGSCPSGTGLVNDLGSAPPPNGGDYRTPSDPWFTDRWLSGPINYTQDFSLEGNTVQSAELEIKIAGIADAWNGFETPYPVRVNSQVVGYIPANTSMNSWEMTKSYIFDLNPTILSGSSIDIEIFSTSCATHDPCDGYSIDYSELRITSAP